MLDRFLRREDQAQHVDVKDLVEVLGRHLFKRRELVDAGVVDEESGGCEPRNQTKQSSSYPTSKVLRFITLTLHITHTSTPDCPERIA